MQVINRVPPIGRDLRESLDQRERVSNGTLEAVGPDKEPLDSIRAMFAPLRGCWVPPPKEEARHGMEYTIRFALKRDGTMTLHRA